MKFKLGDVVTPIPGKLCSGYRFTIIKGEVKGCSSPEYKLKYFGDGIDPAHGPKENQLNRIKIAEDETWFQDEIDYAGKYITIGFPKIEFTSYQEHEPTDGGFTRTGIDTISIGELGMSPIREYYNSLCEKEKNEMKILDLYKDRKLKDLDDRYKDAKNEVKTTDEIQKVITEMQNQVMTILENDGQEIHHDLGTFNLYTRETKRILKDLEDKYVAQKEEIEKTIEEIESLFEMTSSYEDRIKILKNYKVLNKDGKLNV